MLEAVGKALAVTKRELRDEYRAELAALEKRVSDIERAKRSSGKAVVDISPFLARRTG